MTGPKGQTKTEFGENFCILSWTRFDEMYYISGAIESNKAVLDSRHRLCRKFSSDLRSLAPASSFDMAFILYYCLQAEDSLFGGASLSEPVLGF